MKKNSLLLLIFLLLPLHIRADKTLDSLLNVLDKSIQEHEKYVIQRESRIAHLKSLQNGIETNSVEHYDLNKKIYKEYKAFICDSAIHYLNENIRIAEYLHDTCRHIDSKLQLSLLLSSTGMYTESIDVLRSVNRQDISTQLIQNYYTCLNHVYGELSVYTQDKNLSRYYWNISQKYKDSLYTILHPDSEEYLKMREASLCDQHKYTEALNVNGIRLAKAEVNTPQYALVTYHRSLIYKCKMIV